MENKSISGQRGNMCMDGLSGNEKQELKAETSRARMGRDEQHEA